MADRFAARTQEDVKTLRAEATVEAEAETRGKVGLYVTSLKLLARIKSIKQGSVERRRTIRRELQRYSADLLSPVNQLLDDAARHLGEFRRAIGYYEQWLQVVRKADDQRAEVITNQPRQRLRQPG